MMLKLLIVACLVTHGLGRPDVSHLLKRENQRQNDRAFHPLEYLSRQLGNGGEFEARAATASRSSSSSGGGRRAGGRAFRNVVKPSPFKKNAAEFGYTYEKPSDPFDFPINPDANLIKPVSTQAPEYLPPVSQSSQGPVDEQSPVTGMPSSPSYPGSVPEVIATEGPQGPSSTTVAPESGFTTPEISERPSPNLPSGSQFQQDGYRPQEPTSKPEDLDSDMFTGYPLASSPRPVPSFTSASDVEPQQPESQVTTESAFAGYPQGPSSPSYEPSPESTPGFSTSSNDSPQTPTASSLPDERPSTEQEFTGYPQGPSSTASPDQGVTSDASPAPTVFPQGPSQQPGSEFTGYPQGPSSTPSETTATGIPTTTEEQFTGYPQGPSSSSATTDSPATGSTPALLTTEGTEPDKPVLPPNLNEVLGEPFDINDLATTTIQTTTTTRKTEDGAFIPPKPRPELVVPNEPSTSQTPDQTEQPATPSIATSTQAASPGFVPSTSAPEYLPPEGDVAQKPSSGAPTVDVSESSTAAGYPNYSQETTTFAGYPSSDRETTTTTSTTLGYPSSETTTFAGYPPASQQSTTGSGYPSPDRETTTTAKYPEAEQESLPGSGYPSSDRDTTTSTSYPSAGPEASPSSSESGATTAGYPETARETTTASDLPSFNQETTTTSRYPSEESGSTPSYGSPAEQETSTFGGYPNAQVSTTTVVPEYTTVSGASTPAPTTAQEYSPGVTAPTVPDSDQSAGPMSTAAPEYLPPEDDNSTSQYYPPAANTTAELPPTSEPEYRPEQPNISSDNLLNQTAHESPEYTDAPPSEQPETPVNIMDIISEINGMVPDSRPNNGYLPPNPQNTMDLRIVVDDTMSPSPSSRSPVPESEADESELQPRVAPVDSTNGGYNYQVPDQRLPVPAVPSHTLDDDGYHYRVPKVPFLT